MNQTDSTQVQRNPITKQKHRSEVLWQITLPLVIGIVILLTLAVMAGLATSTQASQWADISMIWLIAPTYLVGLITLVVLAGLIYAIIRLILVLPPAAYRLHKSIILFATRINAAQNKIAEPFLRVQVFTASLRALRRNLSGSGDTHSDGA